MFRFANYKDNHILSKVEILVTAALRIDENGIPEYKFYDLKLERQKVDMLPMNWTVVHIIDEDSPLNGFTYNDLVSSDFEVYIQISGFDEVYSSYVLARTSYTYNEVKFNIKYVPMYRESEDEQMTILELHKLNEVVEIK
jgi:inward rectifier potassium channel